MTLHQNAVRLVAKNFRVHQTVHLNGTALSIARQFGVPDHIVCPTPTSASSILELFLAFGGDFTENGAYGYRQAGASRGRALFTFFHASQTFL